MIDILYIEDDINLVRVVGRLIGSRWQLTSATTLAEGLTLLDQFIYDIVLLDLSLPDSHGEKTYRAIRNSGYEGPIIIITGYVDAKVATMLILDGAHDVLIKDDLGRLRGAIKRAMDHGRLRRPASKTVELVTGIDWSALAKARGSG